MDDRTGVYRLTSREVLPWKVCWIIAGCMAFSSGCTPKTSTVTQEQMALKDRSIALLENAGGGQEDGKELVEAAEGFAKLSKAFPNDTLGPRNLLVTLLLRLQKIQQAENPEAYESICKEIEATIANLRRLTPNLPDADDMEARYYAVRSERELAIQSWRKAAKNDKATDVILYQTVDALSMDYQTDSKQEVRSLLEKATRKYPNSIVFSIAYVESLGLNEDKKVLEEMSRLKELLRPIIARTDSKLPALMEKIITDAQNTNWQAVKTGTRVLFNKINPDPSFGNDRKSLKPHELEYLQLNFQQSKLPATARTSDKTLQKFQKTTKFNIENISTRVSAIASEDFDLDSRLDLVTATSKQLAVWSWSNTASKDSGKSFATTQLAQFELDIECNGLVLVDLDRDFQLRKDQFPISALPTTAAPDAAPNPNAMLVDTDVDVIAYGTDGVRLLRNDLDKETGKRSLTSVSLSEEMAALRGVLAIASIDFDHDSDLDLIVSSESGISLWSNRGDWTFADFTSYSSLPPATTRVDSILALDLDRNVLNDFLLGTESVDHPVLLTNNLHGRYQVRDQNWQGKLAGACRATEVIDVNHDACWDVVSCGKQGTRITTMKSIGRHSWLPDSTVELSKQPADGLLVTDVDNDGYADTVVWGSAG